MAYLTEMINLMGEDSGVDQGESKPSTTTEDRVEQLLQLTEDTLVAEINRQIQVSHGVGEHAATQARTIFSQLDMRELAREAADAIGAWQTQAVRTEVARLRSEIAEAHKQQVADQETRDGQAKSDD